MSAIRHGSIKNKVVASDLEAERNKKNFDQQELTHMLWGGADEFARVQGFWEDVEKVDALKASEKWYDYTREEQQENALMRIRTFYDKYNEKYFKNYQQHMIPWYTLNFQGLVITY
jgi:hypothetical protein